MGSLRFPNKPLVKIKGIPMIGHVYYRAKMCQNLSDVYVATCDKEIANYIDSIGGKVVMTRDTHERATDRTSEALEKILNTNVNNISGVLMIQGDEPLVNPILLDEMVSFHTKQKSPYITNLISQIHDEEEFINSNVVKVVCGEKNKILYMSRSPIPSNLKFDDDYVKWKQLGLILFSIKAIKSYSMLEPTKLEIIESVDMNRILENNLEIIAYPTSKVSQAVDVIKDIDIVKTLFTEDKLMDSYG